MTATTTTPTDKTPETLTLEALTRSLADHAEIIKQLTAPPPPPVVRPDPFAALPQILAQLAPIFIRSREEKEASRKDEARELAPEPAYPIPPVPLYEPPAGPKEAKAKADLTVERTKLRESFSQRRAALDSEERIALAELEAQSAPHLAEAHQADQDEAFERFQKQRPAVYHHPPRNGAPAPAPAPLADPIALGA
jgi:hypothetical protein